MEKHILVLYDKEEEYAGLMGEYLRHNGDISWDIHTYTDADILMKQEQPSEVEILVVAESAYDEGLKALFPAKMVMLSENGTTRCDDVFSINKYQQAENVLRSLLEIYAEMAGTEPLELTGEYKTKFIGLYSPVRRCLQTSFALTLGHMLAVEHRTLYLNFEHYAGLMTLLPDSSSRDLADLLYFLGADKEKFKLRMQTIVRQNGDLYYVPAMKSGQNLLSVTEAEWENLLKRIEESGEYEYVILDLTESMQGLLDIMRSCAVIFTMTADDKTAVSKMTQYEQVLALYEYPDVLKKTRKCHVPRIRKIPEEPEQYTKGELAEYVRKQMEGI
jgi:hypothetical protein